MEHAGKGEQQMKAGKVSPEPRLGSIQCDPAPDAQDLLRRFFTLLISRVEGDDRDESERDASLEFPGPEGGANAEA